MIHAAQARRLPDGGEGDAICAKINSLIFELMHCDRGNVTPDAWLAADLGMSRLDLFELVIDLEEAFDVELLDEDIEPWVSVSDVHNTILSRKGIEP